VAGKGCDLVDVPTGTSQIGQAQVAKRMRGSLHPLSERSFRLRPPS
jgi:hypothetical protein